MRVRLLTETWPTTESRRTASANEMDLRLYLRVESELLRSLLRTTVPSDGGLTGLRGPERTPGEVAISPTDHQRHTLELVLLRTLSKNFRVPRF